MMRRFSSSKRSARDMWAALAGEEPLLLETLGELGRCCEDMVGVASRLVELMGVMPDREGCEPLLMLRYPFGGGARDIAAVVNG